MEDRIGKGSTGDPVGLDDGVKNRRWHYILGKRMKIPLSVRVAANYRNRKAFELLREVHIAYS